MEDVAEGVLAFIRWTDENPLPPNAPTRAVMNALRGHLDTTVPTWRTRAYTTRADHEAVEVEVHFSGGRVVRGALVQQPSAVRGKSL